MNRLLRCVALALLATSSVAWAQSKSDIQRMQPWLGVLAATGQHFAQFPS